MPRAKRYDRVVLTRSDGVKQHYTVRREQKKVLSYDRHARSWSRRMPLVAFKAAEKKIRAFVASAYNNARLAQKGNLTVAYDSEMNVIVAQMGRNKKSKKSCAGLYEMKMSYDAESGKARVVSTQVRGVERPEMQSMLQDYFE